MGMKLLKTKLSNLEIFENGVFELDFINEKRVSNSEKISNIVFPLFNNFYDLNSIALVGINASGKTVSLKLISDILNIYIANYGLSSTRNLQYFFKNELEITNILMDDNKLYKIKSYIKKNEENKMYFYEEELKEVNITTQINHVNLSKIFDNIKPTLRSELKTEFLKRDDSIFSAILNQKDKRVGIFDLSFFTNKNIPVLHKFVELDFVRYLDPSIKKLEIISNENDINNIKYQLQFDGSEEVYVLDDLGLDRYLSSGTIKGINILVAIKGVLQTGGYLLVDDFENHINKTLIINLINLFHSELNINGATLIFSTHYTEILDALTRTDGIYIAENNTYIKIKKFSTKAKKYDRSDKKKSELILSGTINRTPTYRSYIALKRNLKNDVAEFK